MYKSFLIFLVFFLKYSQSGHKVNPRIVGGNIVQQRSQFPYQALLLHYYNPRCGGSIIASAFVLTAAQCVVDELGRPVSHLVINVIVGNLKINDTSNRHSVSDIIVHERYNFTSSTADIALLKLADTFTYWTTLVKPINLTTSGTTSGTCVVSGWGATLIDNSYYMSVNLLSAEVPIVSWNSCKENYKDFLDVDNKMICAGTTEKNTCSGDAGGPLVCNGKLTGIVAFGSSNCVDLPSIYVEVARYISWINDKVGYVIVAPEIDQDPTTDPTSDASRTTELPISSTFEPTDGGKGGVQSTFLSIRVLTYCFTLNVFYMFYCKDQ